MKKKSEKQSKEKPGKPGLCITISTVPKGLSPSMKKGKSSGSIKDKK